MKYWIPYQTALAIVFFLGVKNAIDKHVSLSQGNISLLLLCFALGSITTATAILWKIWDNKNGK